MIGRTLSNDALRNLACELADDLVARGLSLGDVERLAPLLVDRVRRSAPRREGNPGRDGGRGRRGGAR